MVHGQVYAGIWGRWVVEMVVYDWLMSGAEP